MATASAEKLAASGRPSAAAGCVHTDIAAALEFFRSPPGSAATDAAGLPVRVDGAKPRSPPALGAQGGGLAAAACASIADEAQAAVLRRQARVSSALP
eukprot:7224844-Prymnesium_polylepis.2